MIQSFFHELSRPAVSHLSESEEAECWRKYKEEDNIDARAKIIETYQYLVYKIVSTIKTNDEVAKLDLVQEGTVGLIEAVEKFLPAKDIKFTTYAPFRIRGRIINYINKNSQQTAELDSNTQALFDIVTSAQTYINPTGQKAKNIEKIAEDDMLLSVVLKNFERLSAKEKDVVTGIYLHDKKATDLAKEMGISNSYLSRLQKRAIKRLRGMLSRMMKEMK